MLKRTLSLLTALALLLTGAVMLTSCGNALSVEEVEKNPSAILKKAISENALFADEMGFEDAMKAAMESGAVEIDWDASALGELYPDIKATLYLDQAEKKAVLDATLEGDLFGEETSPNRLYLSGETLMIHSPLLLGSERTLAFHRATVKEKLADSALAELFGMSEKDSLEMVESLESLWETMDKSLSGASKESDGKSEEFINGMLARLEQSVSTGKAKNADGKDVDCVILSYKINENTVAAMSDYMSGVARLNEVDVSNAKGAGLDLTLSVRVDSATGALVSIGLAGEIEYRDEDQGGYLDTPMLTGRILAEAVFGDSEMRLTLSGDNGEESIERTATLTKKVSGDTASYEVHAVTDGEDTLRASISYDKKSGALALSCKTYEDGEEDEALEIKGTLKTDKGGTILTVDTYQAGAVTVELGIKLSFIKDAQMPAFPTDATDVLSMTEKELGALAEELQYGLLGMLMMGFGI